MARMRVELRQSWPIADLGVVAVLETLAVQDSHLVLNGRQSGFAAAAKQECFLDLPSGPNSWS